jgi:hypothetical protein
MSMSQNVTVNWRIRAEGFEMKAIDYAMFTVGGGVHCSLHVLRHCRVNLNLCLLLDGGLPTIGICWLL